MDISLKLGIYILRLGRAKVKIYLTVPFYAFIQSKFSMWAEALQGEIANAVEWNHGLHRCNKPKQQEVSIEEYLLIDLRTVGEFPH